MGLNMKNFNIMGVHQFLGEGDRVIKSNIMGELCKNRSWDNLHGGWQKRGRRLFLRGC